ncbi:MAG: threonine/serine exporter family protein [Peptococcaceae bacterium]|nr:threonine/serine exporter family protein [Peptococcaceae bacterium]
MTTQTAMNEKYDCQMALKMAVMLGVMLMENGAEVYRVEESILRVLRSYGIKRTDVYALPNIIIVTIETEEDISYTKTRRIYQNNPNFERVVRLNDLARRISTTPIPLCDAFRELKSIDRQKYYPLLVDWVSYVLAAASFAMMIGGTVWDGAVAILCTFLGRLARVPMERYHANNFFLTVVASYIHNVVAYAFAHAFVGLHVNTIITGSLMMLFPGVAFMTALRDVIARDLNAGMFEAMEAVVVAGSIAIGSALAYATFPYIARVI